MDTREPAAAFRLNKWMQIIQECRSSGKTIKEWCAEHDIKESAYFYWQNKVRIKACDTLPALGTSGSTQIVQVKLPIREDKEEAGQTADIILHIGTATLELRNGASASLIENTLRALQNVR